MGLRLGGWVRQGLKGLAVGMCTAVWSPFQLYDVPSGLHVCAFREK